MYAVNHLPKRNLDDSPTGCCPRFDPKGWDGETFQFDDKPFVKVVTRSFLHIPINMNSVMKKTMQILHAAGADKDDEYIMLSYDASPWKSEHYISVDRPVDGLENVKLTGTYLAKVFEGQFRDAGKWYRELVDYVKSRGKQPAKLYFSYTTCPGCAKVYGKNYVLGLAQV